MQMIIIKVIGMCVYEFDCYERAVRSEDPSQDISIINCYVHIGVEQAMRCTTAEKTKVIYLRILATLEETFCDLLLTFKWRHYCYRVIKRLMPVIFEMISEQEYLHLNARLDALSQYFLPKQIT